MSDILCVTNRKLCREDFLIRVKEIALAQPKGLILREKDLPRQEYQLLAEQVLDICREAHVPCILHSFVDAALELRAENIHLPLPVLRSMTQPQKARFSQIGASCLSTADALEAAQLGCTYITAGHIFDTDCKQGLPGRGLPFLEDICQAAAVPVYAIGGISPKNIRDVRRAGANGACLMSSLMTCENVQELLAAMEE